MKKYPLLLLFAFSFLHAEYLLDYGARLQCVDDFYYENKHYYLWYKESDTKTWVRYLEGNIPSFIDGFEYKDGKCIKTSNDTLMMSLTGIFCGFLTLCGMIYLTLKVHR
ncbi:MAG: hypothetical protein LBP40_08260 [Campylobacteraceae bacterium]|jgi:hypothetical protein|nr:hypothetical protein [Campylobacteraceae bacterium]